MRLPIWRLRTAAVLLAGAFVLHQLRYGPLPDAHGDDGHGYLPAAAAVVAGILALAGLQFAFGLLAAWRGRRTAAGPSSLPRLWARATVFLLTIHSAQEGVEALASGRSLAPLASGWWLAVLLAMAIGLAAALLLRGGAVAVALVLAVRARRRAQPQPGASRMPRPARIASRRLQTPLARHLAGRAPPFSLT